MRPSRVGCERVEVVGGRLWMWWLGARGQRWLWLWWVEVVAGSGYGWAEEVVVGLNPISRLREEGDGGGDASGGGGVRATSPPTRLREGGGSCRGDGGDGGAGAKSPPTHVCAREVVAVVEMVVEVASQWAVVVKRPTRICVREWGGCGDAAKQWMVVGGGRWPVTWQSRIWVREGSGGSEWPWWPVVAGGRCWFVASDVGARGPAEGWQGKCWVELNATLSRPTSTKTIYYQ